ncbi:MAG: MATE family efflux transporter [Pseudomonadota bacterium]|nr:MATE family efflux transporter [Pseudomonadota bacterium]
MSPSPYVLSLLRVALPLILAGLSANLSIFIDRSILSHHSSEMMSSVTAVMNYCWTFLFATTGITWISKVFVGQFNGAEEYEKASEITWQMIFFSCACFGVFFLAYLASPFIVPSFAQEHGLIYFQVIMLGGILWPLASSLASFLMGTYQIRSLFVGLVIANMINVGLDLLWIPTMGTYGAALATIVSMVFQVVYLFLCFFNAYNRKRYKTQNVQLNFDLMKRAIILGYPESISHACEMFAWATVLSIIATKGDDYILVSTLAQNLFILFMFVYSELGNAVKAMASNYIGQHQRSHIPRLIQSAMKIHTSFMLMIAASLYFQPGWFIALFALGEQNIALQQTVMLSLQGVMLFMFLDGIAYLMASLLSAYGDTFASMMITAINMWLFLVLPTYILIHFYATTASTHSLIILPFYGIVTASCYIWRQKVASGQELSVMPATL